MHPVVFCWIFLVNFYLFLKLKGQLLFCILDISLLHKEKVSSEHVFSVRSSA